MAEIIIGVAIIATLSAFAIPAFRLWIVNTQIRSMAESIQTGLQLARSEAVRRNGTMRFQLVTSNTNSCTLSATANNWIVSERDPTARCATTPTDRESPVDAVNPRIKQMRMGSEGTGRTAVSSTIGGVPNALIAFGALGQTTTGGNSLIQVTAPGAGTCTHAGGELRCLNILVSFGGQTRMCDPARTSTVTNPDPQACVTL